MRTYLPFCAGCGNALCLLCGHIAVAEAANAPAKKRLFFPQDGLIYGAGDSATGVYCIYSGGIKVYQCIGADVQLTIHAAGPGEIIGFNSISGGVFVNSAVATMDTYVCLIPLTDIRKLLKLMSATTDAILHNKV